MNDIRKNILKKVYDDCYSNNGFAELSYSDYSSFDIDYLVNRKLIVAEEELLEFGCYSITPSGIDLVENNFVETPATTGNNIIINGSNNVISNNFNTITKNITNTDIDENLKDELINFINELSSCKQDKPTILNKITTFVSNVISNTTTEIAVVQLSALISSLLS